MPPPADKILYFSVLYSGAEGPISPRSEQFYYHCIPIRVNTFQPIVLYYSRKYSSNNGFVFGRSMCTDFLATLKATSYQPESYKTIPVPILMFVVIPGFSCSADAGPPALREL